MSTTLELTNASPVMELPQPQRLTGRRLSDRGAGVLLALGLTLFGAATISSGITPVPGSVGPHAVATQTR